ncbi:MAG: TolC family protein [Planctomycetes bacterium]|nr:TolC family protein [Planctomycetota bacterium]MCG2685552.1 TolC family protein [Planctomycetales bacterium]
MYRLWNTAGKSLNGRGASGSFVTTRSVATRNLSLRLPPSAFRLPSPAPRPPSWQRWCLIALLVLILSGCTRARYRHRADNEVYGLIGCAMADPRWVLKDYSITPSPESRMFDPDNPDRPPMPPDDPTSAELMRCVDGKRGWPHWCRNGSTPCVENPAWMNYLPRDENGVMVLDRSTAVQTALLNSREYQSELEQLYLSALDVTFQRFRFDAQFFGVNSTFFTADGPDRFGVGGQSSSLLEEDNSLEVRKLTATGGEIIAGIANSLVWQFAGPDEYTATTLLDFSMVQPLLRAGGRAVVMENLTDSERALLANVRQMERFRHGFYAQIVAGSSPGAGPARGGLGLDALQPALPGGAGGIFDLMETKVRINNQRSNVAGLRDSLDQFEAFYDAERIDKLQVDQTRQTLYHAQIQLASLKQDYQDGLDGYKISLGLPPSLDVRIDDPLLDPFELIDEKTVAAQEMVAALLVKLRDPDAPFTAEDTADALDVLPRDCRAVLEIMERDLRRLDEAVPARRNFLKLLVNRPELRNGDVDPSAADLKYFERRLAKIRDDFVKQQASMRAALDEYEQFARASKERAAVGPDDRETGPPETKGLMDFLTRFSDELAELSLTQARCRVETATLTPVDLAPDEALEIARRNRLDWMNARAALVDSWRRIEVSANALRSDLDVTFSGDINTLGNNPIRFRGTTGRLRVGLQFDPPLTRLAERNLYRESLIDYQRARRRYYAYEDRVSQSLRDILRTINRYQLDFELRRAAVHVAISQVDVMQLRLQRPPEPGKPNVFGDTTARDLVGALSGLLSSQNSFLSAWVDYEVQRLNLDFDLGTMQLDARGEWIDPGPIRFDRYLSSEADAPAAGRTEEIPTPDAMPIPEALPSP